MSLTFVRSVFHYSEEIYCMFPQNLPTSLSHWGALGSGVSCKTVKCHWESLQCSLCGFSFTLPRFPNISGVSALRVQLSTDRWPISHDGVSYFVLVFPRAFNCSLRSLRQCCFFSVGQKLQESSESSGYRLLCRPSKSVIYHVGVLLPPGYFHSCQIWKDL